MLSPLPPIIVPCRLRYNKLEDDLTDPYSYPHLWMFTSHVAPTACHLCECSRTHHALEGPLSTVSPHVVCEVVCIARCVWAEVTVERLPPHADRASSRSTFSNALDDTMPVWPGLICLLGNIEKNWSSVASITRCCCICGRQCQCFNEGTKLSRAPKWTQQL